MEWTKNEELKVGTEESTGTMVGWVEREESFDAYL